MTQRLTELTEGLGLCVFTTLPSDSDIKQSLRTLFGVHMSCFLVLKTKPIKLPRFMSPFSTQFLNWSNGVYRSCPCKSKWLLSYLVSHSFSLSTCPLPTTELRLLSSQCYYSHLDMETLLYNTSSVTLLTPCSGPSLCLGPITYPLKPIST